LHDFGIETSDEGPGADEPFLWVFYYRVDGRELLQSSASEAQLHLVAPPCQHSNVVGSRILVVPFEDSIEPGSLGTASLVGLHVAFLEEDGTPDSTINAAHSLAVAEARRQGNEVLRRALTTGGEVNLAIDERAFRKTIEEGLAPEIFATKVKIGVGAMLGLPIFFGEADRDDNVGNGGAMWRLAEVIGNNDHDTEFKISGGGEGHGRYFVRGSLRRTDTDEVPTIAAMKTGPDAIKLYARNIGDTLSVYASKDAGRSFEPKGLFGEARRFRSGPGVAASADGRHRHVMGLSTDAHYFHTRSADHGESWTDWEEMGTKEFTSAPAVTCSADGKWVHAVGRTTGDLYFHRVSKNSGRDWSAWTPIREAEFQSSPAVTVSPDGSRLVAFGTSRQKVWWTGSNDHGESWSRWESIPVPLTTGNVYDEPMRAATSGPAASFLNGGKTLQVACRGIDHGVSLIESSDGGRSWPSHWHRIGGNLNSSPALVFDDSRPCCFGLGDDLTLQRCVKIGGTWEEPQDPVLEWKSVHRGQAPFGLQPLFY
jgi:hypothetical protein